MTYEYKVVEERLGSPKGMQDDLNEQASVGWEFYALSTIGPIPSRWLIFRRPVQEGGSHVLRSSSPGSGDPPLVGGQ